MSIVNPQEAIDIQRAEDLDTLFAPGRSGYLGADGALSVDLGGGRALWLFGDTLFGETGRDGRVFTSMPRNTIALVDHSHPDPPGIDFLTADGPAKGGDILPLPGGKSGRWFWPGTGFTHRGAVYLIGYGVESGGGSIEALSFDVTGTWLFRIRGLEGPPGKWDVRAVPFKPLWKSAYFCSAHAVEGDVLHLLGLERPGDGNWRRAGAVLGRLPLSALDEGNPGAALEWFAGGEEGWSRGDVPPAALYRPGVTECSLFRDEPRGRYIATTYDAREGVMRLTTAPRLAGPWEPPFPVYRVPEFAGVDHHLAYTFRMHPHLANGPDEMVLTYVVNTTSLETLAREEAVYYPRFLRLNLNGF